jgi:hypothetical protein
MEAATQWRIRSGARGEWQGADGRTRYTNEHGYCDPDTRTIWLGRQDKETLIHEICHAVAGGGHGKKFTSRLRQAAARARQLGDHELGSALMQEAEDYESTPRTGAKEVYGRVSDVCMDSGSVTLGQLIDYLAYEYGATGPEIIARYPRLAEVYEVENRRWTRERERMRQWRESILAAQSA